MLYRKVRVSYIGDKKGLYRILYVPEGILLSDFAEIIKETFRMSGEHLYEFRKNRIRYVSEITDDDDDPWRDEAVYKMDCFCLTDPGDTYRFLYDFGEDWEFEVRIYKMTKEFDGDSAVIVVEGKGKGIWEDHRWGYHSLLSGEMPGSLKEDDEERGFYLPWNIDLDRADDTFAAIDPDVETGYLNEVVSLTDKGEDGIWAQFNRKYDQAVDKTFREEEMGLWPEVFDCFKQVCGKLKEEGKLPEQFLQIVEMYPDFEGEYMMDFLSGAFYGEDLWQAMDEMEHMFQPDGQTEFDIIEGKCDALIELGNNAKLLEYTRDMYKRYPESNTVRGCRMNAFRIGHKKKDGIAFMEEILKSEPEYTPDNESFYMAALKFADDYGLKKMSRKLQAEIDRYHEEHFDELDELDDFVSELEDTHAIKLLHQAVIEYKNNPEERSFRNMLSAFAYFVMQDELVYVGSREKDNQPYRKALQMITDPQQKEMHIAVFTEDTNDLPEGVTLFQERIQKVCHYVVDNKIDGLAFDCKDSEKHSALIDREYIELMFEWLENNAK